MKISQKQLLDIAFLARLDISKNELKVYEKEFNDIVEYVGILKKIKIKKGVSLEGAVDAEKILKSDQADPYKISKKWKNNVSKIDGEYIAVKSIFNDEQR